MASTFGIGLVGEYDAVTRVYRVQLDVYGDVLARALVSGIDRPYSQFARVALARVPGAEWLILGELAMSAPPPVADRKVDEYVADEVIAGFNQLSRAARDSITADTLPPFRAVDEGPRFIGDAVLENRTLDPKLRSFFRVYAFGSLLANASKICFTFWDKASNLVLQQSRDLIIRCFGYLRSVTTDLEKKNTTVSETLSGQPGVLDVDRTEGYLPALMRGGDLMEQPTAEYGARARYRDTKVIEVDTVAEVQRSRVDVAGATVKTSWEGSLADVEAGTGDVIRYGDWLEIVVDLEAKTLAIVDKERDQTMRLTPETLELRRGAQKITLDDASLAVEGTDVTISASRSLTLSAPRIPIITNG